MRKLELLIPAGSLDVLKTAVLYGADAVHSWRGVWSAGKGEEFYERRDQRGHCVRP